MQTSKGFSRDLFVLMVMAFAFGVLAAWGLFYTWGSAPRTKPIDLAAWTQAIGSSLAICLAIYVPWQQRRHQIHDQSAQESKAEARERELIRAMHIALFSPVESYRVNCTVALNALNHSERKRRVFFVEFGEEAFSRPAEFDQFRANLYLMGDVGHDINILISLQDNMRRALGILRRETLSKKQEEKARGRLENFVSRSTEICATIQRVARAKKHP